MSNEYGLGKDTFASRKEYYDINHNKVLDYALSLLEHHNIPCGKSTEQEDKEEKWDYWVWTKDNQWNIKVTRGRRYTNLKNLSDADYHKELMENQSTTQFSNKPRCFCITGKNEIISDEEALHLASLLVNKHIEKDYVLGYWYDHIGTYMERQQGMGGKSMTYHERGVIVYLNDKVSAKKPSPHNSLKNLFKKVFSR